MVLASAGTGKTFTLSSRLIDLLTQGAGPEHLLASTFTRKAAGEILQRVLERLAAASLDGEAARQVDLVDVACAQVALDDRDRFCVPGGVRAQARHGDARRGCTV